MTSRSKRTECFVYITLPGETSAVTCGRFELTPAGVGRFVYGRSYLARPDAVEVDPVELRLAPRAYETASNQGVFGALRDSGPDWWGRRIIERHAGKLPLSELDYLLLSPDDRAGALAFGLGVDPPAPRREFNQVLQLERLQAIADAIMEERDLPAGPESGQVSELLLVGTSMGGARPKAVVEDGEGLWLAKFNCKTDRFNFARVERAMLVLARACGIDAAHSKVVKVGGRDVLLVKRFDREKGEGGYRRARMVSALTILRASDSPTSRERWSYVLLSEEARRICAEPKRVANELFQRMCFNGLISNTDDHPRNHAFVAKDRDWSLSPAYDLLPSSAVSADHRDLALACGDWGRHANAQNFLSQRARFLLDRAAAEHIVEDMLERVRRHWRSTACAEGVSARDCETIESAFAYPGFVHRLG